MDYLITEYGWTEMQRLLDVFSEGTTYEGAIERVYGMNLDGLEATWLLSLGRGSS